MLLRGQRSIGGRSPRWPAACLACLAGASISLACFWFVSWVEPLFGPRPDTPIANLLRPIVARRYGQPFMGALGCVFVWTPIILATMGVYQLLRGREGYWPRVLRCLHCGRVLQNLDETSCPSCGLRLGETGEDSEQSGTDADPASEFSTGRRGLTAAWIVWLLSWGFGLLIAFAWHFLCARLSPYADADESGPAFTLRVWGELLGWMPVTPMVFRIAVITFATLPMMLGVTIMYEFLRSRMSRNVEELRCRRCGYNLRGLKEPRCPECGERV
jgi:ribosomal protein L37E